MSTAEKLTTSPSPAKDLRGKLILRPDCAIFEAYGTSASLRRLEAIRYLEQLLPNPYKVFPARNLMPLRETSPSEFGDDCKARDRNGNSITSVDFSLFNGASVQPAADPETIRAVWERVKWLRLEWRRLRKEASVADSAGALARARELRHASRTAREELPRLEAYLDESLTRFGKAKNLNGAPKRDSARNSTKRNLGLVYKKLVLARMPELAKHLEKYVAYAEGAWSYRYPKAWIVE